MKSFTQSLTHSRSHIMLAASALLLSGVLAVRFLGDGFRAAPTPTPNTISAKGNADPTDLFGAEDTQSLVSTLQNQIKTLENATTMKREGAQGELYAQLGWAFLQRARETADPTHYTQAQQALDAALKRDAQNVDALLGQGALALSRHEFAQAIAWAEQAKAINPFRAQIYGVLGDGYVELGRYADATTAIQKMVDTRPDLNSYSRVSYMRELHGDTAGAIDAMRRAVQAGNPANEGTLWTLYQLGNLYFNSGDVTQAEQTYQAALSVKPSYVFARAGMAKIWVAQGQLGKAIAEYKQLSEQLPLPEFVITLGELYERTGEFEKAHMQFELVRVIQKLNASAAMNVDMELALFEADLAPKANAELVSKARAAYTHRPSIYAADVLAWSLYKAGQFPEAKKYSDEALKLGTKDALLHFHAGMISLALADKASAKMHLQTALQINPNFSIRYAPVAHATLKQLS